MRIAKSINSQKAEFIQYLHTLERENEDFHTLQDYLKRNKWDALVFELPNQLLVTTTGVRMRNPPHDSSGWYYSNRPLSARRLKIKDPELAKQEITERLRFLASAPSDQNASFLGVDRGQEFKCIVQNTLSSGLRKVVGVLTAPIWGTAWAVRKLVENYAPR